MRVGELDWTGSCVLSFITSLFAKRQQQQIKVKAKQMQMTGD